MNININNPNMIKSHTAIFLTQQAERQAKWPATRPGHKKAGRQTTKAGHQQRGKQDGHTWRASASDWYCRERPLMSRLARPFMARRASGATSLFPPVCMQTMVCRKLTYRLQCTVLAVCPGQINSTNACRLNTAAYLDQQGQMRTLYANMHAADTKSLFSLVSDWCNWFLTRQSEVSTQQRACAEDILTGTKHTRLKAHK